MFIKDCLKYINCAHACLNKVIVIFNDNILHDRQIITAVQNDKPLFQNLQ